MSRALGDSKSPEEVRPIYILLWASLPCSPSNNRPLPQALLKACSHFTLDPNETDPTKRAEDVCEVILKIRSEQLDDCKKEARESIATLVAMHEEATSKGYYKALKGKQPDVQHFSDWLKSVSPRLLLTLAVGTLSNATRPQAYSDDVRDAEASIEIRRLIEEAGCDATGIRKAPKTDGLDNPVWRKWIGLDKDGKVPKKKVAKGPTYEKDQIYQIRQATAGRNGLATLCKELSGRYQSRRFFEAIRNLQSGGDECADQAILSYCGHQGPVDLVVSEAQAHRCVEPKCHAAIRPHHVVLPTDLGVSARNTEFGAKLEKLVEIIDSIPEDDRILIFCQFPELFTQVQETLASYGIVATTLIGGVVKSMYVPCRAVHWHVRLSDTIFVMNLSARISKISKILRVTHE